MDLAVGGVLLSISLPIQLGVALAVRLRLGSPVLFRQERPGLGGQPFQMLKFRTMTDDVDADGQLLPDELRLPRFGQFLRSTSLDELPELTNVVRGELSLVGPRPLLTRYLDRYSARQMRRHAVKPGVTGLAQVSGRNALTWDDKFELDLRYVQTVSLTLDLRILFRTVWNVIRRKDISSDSHATMPEFGIEPC
ncbi:MAG: sugar transferase [Actinobacteria bacterium]|nr:sugar transferase [Actinomycetota bacterium]